MTPSDPAVDAESQNEDRGRRLLAWAHERLGTSVESLQSLPQEWLATLEAENFVPSESWGKAVSIVLHEGRNHSGELPAYLEDELEQRLADFRRDFFSLDPVLREQRFAELSHDAQFHPRLEGQLRRMKRGLSLSQADIDNAPRHVKRLLEAVRQLFVLREPARAARRREIAEDLDWEDESRVDYRSFEREHPEWAKLDPALVAALRNATRDSATQASTYVTIGKNRPPAEENHSTWDNWRMIAIVVASVSALFRMINSSPPAPINSYPTPYQYQSQTNWQEVEDAVRADDAKVSESLKALVDPSYLRKMREERQPAKEDPASVVPPPPPNRKKEPAKPKPLPKDLILLPTLPADSETEPPPPADKEGDR